MAAPEYFEWMDRGRAHQREGRPIDAMLCYHRAARIDPSASDPHFALGETHWQLGRLPDAITAWREASRITRNHMAPVQAEAEALLAIGDTDGAVAAAKRVQTLMPKDARAALIRGIGALAEADPADPAPAAAIDALIAREPSLLAIPTLAGPLALALEHAPAGADREALLDRIARAPEALATAVPQLLVVALEHVVRTDSFDAGARARLAAVACARNFAPADHDLLRRVARAVVDVRRRVRAHPRQGVRVDVRGRVRAAGAAAVARAHCRRALARRRPCRRRRQRSKSRDRPGAPRGRVRRRCRDDRCRVAGDRRRDRHRACPCLRIPRQRGSSPPAIRTSSSTSSDWPR